MALGGNTRSSNRVGTAEWSGQNRGECGEENGDGRRKERALDLRDHRSTLDDSSCHLVSVVHQG